MSPTLPSRFIVLLAALLHMAAAAASSPPQRNVLVLYSYDDSLPWQRLVRQGLQARLGERPEAPSVRLFEERLDGIRLGRPQDGGSWTEYLRRKYQSVHLDAVIAEGEDAARLLVSQSALYGGARRYLVNPGGVVPGEGRETPVSGAEDYEQNLRTILAMSPKARHLVVVGDLETTRIERLRVEKLRSAWESHFRDRIGFEVWANDFSFDELHERAARLPSDSILLYALVTKDRTGARAAPYTVLETLARRSSVPVFATHDSLLGSGTVGGHLLSAARTGNIMAELSMGATPESFPQAYFSVSEFDGRALDRWNIPDSLLPKGATVRFRDPPFWEQHKELILYGIPIILVEALLLLILARALRARSIAMRELAEERAQVEQRVVERTTELAHSEEQLRFVLDGAELGFWDWNIVTGVVERNERWATMLGHSHEEIQPTTQQWEDFLFPDDRESARQSVRAVLDGASPTLRIEYRMRHKDGSIRWILDQAKVMQRDADGCPIRMCGTHTDITDRKRLEQELQRQAHIDYLTGVCNRAHFMEQAELELARAIRYGGELSVFMMDIDLFKQINDRHGHKVGDLVLTKVAQACQATLRTVDILGRIGGEEFAILLPETSKTVATEVAERLREAIANIRVPLENGLPVSCTVSIGVTSMTLQGENVDVLLNCADQALYQAKHLGRNRVCVA